MNIFIAAIVVTTLTWVFTLRRVAKNFRGLPSIGEEAAPFDTPLPPSTVIIPARNEEENLRALLPLLLESKYRGEVEFVVVDDGSGDGTGRVAEDFAKMDQRVKLLGPEPLPVGWTGKTFSLERGVEHSKEGSKYLVFIDADVRPGRDALRRGLIFAERRGADLLCLLCRPVYGTFWEKVIMPSAISVLAPMINTGRINDPEEEDASAIGQFLIVKRSSLLQVGGFERVRGEVLEDIELARLMKRNRFRLLLASGEELCRVRMYRNFREIFTGLGKNAFPLIERSIPSLLLLTATLLLLHLLPFALPFYAWRVMGGWGILLSALPLSLLLFYRNGVNRVSGTGFGYALLHPAGILLYFAIHIYSFLIHLLGIGGSWKGRRIR